MRKYGIIIAARTGSKRLPGKVLLPIHNLPMIVFLIRRVLNTKLADKIVFATTCLPEDDELCAVVRREGIPVFRGAEPSRGKAHQSPDSGSSSRTARSRTLRVR